MRRTTRRVSIDQVADLLAAPPRASVAVCHGDTLEAGPVAFRREADRLLVGVPPGGYPALGDGDLVKLLIDDGRWFFDLRGVWFRGRLTVVGTERSLTWFELLPDRAVAWDYGTLATVAEAATDAP